jgi:hypothetical protein
MSSYCMFRPHACGSTLRQPFVIGADIAPGEAMSRTAAHPAMLACGPIGTLGDHAQAPGDPQAHYPEYTSCQQEPPHHAPSALTAEVAITICAPFRKGACISVPSALNIRRADYGCRQDGSTGGQGRVQKCHEFLTLLDAVFTLLDSLLGMQAIQWTGGVPDVGAEAVPWTVGPHERNSGRSYDTRFTHR